MHRLDVLWLHRNGMLGEDSQAHGLTWSRPYCPLAGAATFVSDRHQVRGVASLRGPLDGDGPRARFEVDIVWHPCRFGGARPYFTCGNCGRSVRHVSLSQSQTACRHCFRLTYASRREDRIERLHRKSGKILDRLEAAPSDRKPPKPKWMHWATYESHLAELATIQAELDRNLMGALSKIEARLDRR